MASHKNGHLVKCSVCTQEWFEFSFGSEMTDFQPEHSELRKLAIEEYLFNPEQGKQSDFVTSKKLPNMDKDEHLNQEPSDLKDIRQRLKVSTVLLKEATEKLKSVESIDSNGRATLNASTCLGFICVSVIFLGMFVLHLYNIELRNTFPSLSGMLDSYYSFSSHIVEIISATLKANIFLS